MTPYTPEEIALLDEFVKAAPKWCEETKKRFAHPLTGGCFVCGLNPDKILALSKAVEAILVESKRISKEQKEEEDKKGALSSGAAGLSKCCGMHAFAYSNSKVENYYVCSRCGKVCDLK